MKLLFYSCDTNEVQQARSECATAGIPCEVRNSPVLPTECPDPPCSELWVCNDKDCSRALMICVQLGVGFSRRPREENGEVVECDFEDSESFEFHRAV